MKKNLLRRVVSVFVISSVIGSGYGVSTNVQANDTKISYVQEEQNDEVYVVRELENERTENSNTYLLSNGTKKKEIYAEDVRFEKDGKYIEYNTSLAILASNDKIVLEDKIDTVADEYIYVNTSGDSKHYFPENLTDDTGVITSSDEYMLSFAPITNEDYVPIASNDMVTYSSVDSDVKYQYFSLKNGVKENIILPKKPKDNVFSFTIETENIELQLVEGYGGINLLDKITKEIVGNIEPPNIVDGNGNITYDDIEYSIEKNGRKDILKLTVNESYFENEELKYPVTIDPTAKWFSDKLSLYTVCNMPYIANMNIPATDVYVNNKSRTDAPYVGTEQRVYLNTANVVSGNAFCR